MSSAISLRGFPGCGVAEFSGEVELDFGGFGHAFGAVEFAEKHVEGWGFGRETDGSFGFGLRLLVVVLGFVEAAELLVDGGVAGAELFGLEQEREGLVEMVLLSEEGSAKEVGVGVFAKGVFLPVDGVGVAGEGVFIVVLGFEDEAEVGFGTDVVRAEDEGFAVGGAGGFATLIVSRGSDRGSTRRWRFVAVAG